VGIITKTVLKKRVFFLVKNVGHFEEKVPIIFEEKWFSCR
jgi:hypothetical protein